MNDRVQRRIQHYDSILNRLDDLIALEAIQELGIFRLLLDEARSGPELAEATGCSAKRLAPFLDLVVQLGFLSRVCDLYALIPGDSEVFDPESAHGGVLGFGNLNRYLGRRARAVDVLRSDTPVPSAATGGKVSRELQVEFLGSIHRASVTAAQEVATILARWPSGRLADLGCGAGTYTAAWLRQHPESQALAVDSHGESDFVARIGEESGVADRMTFMQGDMLSDDFGTGFDIVLGSEIIHNFSPEQNRLLFQRIAQRLRPGGILVIKDTELDDDKLGPQDILRFRLALAIFSEQGDIYSEAQVLGWMKEAGLCHEITYALRSRPGSYLIIASRPQS